MYFSSQSESLIRSQWPSPSSLAFLKSDASTLHGGGNREVDTQNVVARQPGDDVVAESGEQSLLY